MIFSSPRRFSSKPFSSARDPSNSNTAYLRHQQPTNQPRTAATAQPMMVTRAGGQQQQRAVAGVEHTRPCAPLLEQLALFQGRRQHHAAVGAVDFEVDGALALLVERAGLLVSKVLVLCATPTPRPHRHDNAGEQGAPSEATAVVAARRVCLVPVECGGFECATWWLV